MGEYFLRVANLFVEVQVILTCRRVWGCVSLMFFSLRWRFHRSRTRAPEEREPTEQSSKRTEEQGSKKWGKNRKLKAEKNIATTSRLFSLFLLSTDIMGDVWSSRTFQRKVLANERLEHSSGREISCQGRPECHAAPQKEYSAGPKQSRKPCSKDIFWMYKKRPDYYGDYSP